MPISTSLLIVLLILALPLAGAILALMAGRFLPKRFVVVLAALPFFLATVAILILVQRPLSGEGLGQALTPTSSTPQAMRFAPTARWAQAPRTLIVTPLLTSTATPTPTPVRTRPPTVHPLSLATVVVRNGTGESGLATRTTRELQAQGFRVLPPEDDTRVGERPRTLILDRGDHPEVRQALASYLHVPPGQIRTNAREQSDADIILIIGDDFHQLGEATSTPTPRVVAEPQATRTPHPLSAASILVLNGTRRSGLAGQTAELLQEAGFQVFDLGNDEIGDRPHTLILDRGDHTAVRQALAELLNVDEAYITINADYDTEADIVVILGNDYEE